VLSDVKRCRIVDCRTRLLVLNVYVRAVFVSVAVAYKHGGLAQITRRLRPVLQRRLNCPGEISGQRFKRICSLTTKQIV